MDTRVTDALSLIAKKELEVLRNKNVENPPRKHSNVPL